MTHPSPTSFAPKVPLRATALAKAYATSPVLNGVSFEIQAGEMVGLLGRNGAGKTTLLACLLGLARPDAGEAFVLGCPSLALSDAEKAVLGYVPQNPMDTFGGWSTPASLFEFLAPLYPTWDRARALALLRRWQLNDRQPIHKMSPGEQQRLAIVRALTPRPQVIVLDEPASALDPIGRRELLGEIVASAGEEGSTVVFSTHIVSDVERVASRVLFLHEGRVALDDEPERLKANVVRVVTSPGVPPGPLGAAGELSRRVGSQGETLGLVWRGSQAHHAWLDRGAVSAEHLGLEDLLVELASPRHALIAAPRSFLETEPA